MECPQCGMEECICEGPVFVEEPNRLYPAHFRPPGNGGPDPVDETPAAKKDNDEESDKPA
ncbi:MAG: hypothetical protein Q8Q20_00890 [bacterium]|nr:hypothetical protein [bacterium]